MLRKSLMLLAVVIIGGAITYYFAFSDSSEPSTTAAEPLQVSAASDSFSVSVQRALGEYFIMTEAFVQKDTAAIHAASGSFASSMQQIAWQELKADSQLVSLATSLQAAILTENASIANNSDWTAKYRSLQSISDQLYDMLRIVQFKGSKVYQQHCPMAFDNTGANWLSQQSAIRNPYFGDEMLDCGNTRDSVDFVK